ncbi:MAG: carboxypeptidase-like regulatory domain-containing protein [Candidatus Berkelbacteria bacterium]
MEERSRVFKNHRLIVIFFVVILILFAAITIALVNKGYFKSSADSVAGGGTIYVAIKDGNGSQSWSGIPVKASNTITGKALLAVTDYSGVAKFIGVENGNYTIAYTDPGCTSNQTISTSISYSTRTASVTGKLCPTTIANSFTVTGKVIGDGIYPMALSALVGSSASKIQTRSEFSTGNFSLAGFKVTGGNAGSYSIILGGVNGYKVTTYTLAQLGITGIPIAGKTYALSTLAKMQFSSTPPTPPSISPDIYYTVKTDCKAAVCTNRDTRGRVSGLPVSIEYSTSPAQTTNNNLSLYADRDYNGVFKGVSVGSPIFVVNSKNSPSYNPAYETFMTWVPAMTKSNYSLDGSAYYYVAEFLIHQKNTKVGTSLSGRVINSTGGSVSGLTVSYGGKTSITDANGNYSLTGFIAGDATITVCPGFTSTISKLTTEANQKISNFDLPVYPTSSIVNTGCTK